MSLLVLIWHWSCPLGPLLFQLTGAFFKKKLYLFIYFKSYHCSTALLSESFSFLSPPYILPPASLYLPPVALPAFPRVLIVALFILRPLYWLLFWEQRARNVLIFSICHSVGGNDWEAEDDERQGESEEEGCGRLISGALLHFPSALCATAP